MEKLQHANAQVYRNAAKELLKLLVYRIATKELP